MLLALDIGNTNVVAALYEGDRQMGLWRFTPCLPCGTAFRHLADNLGDAVSLSMVHHCRCSRTHTSGTGRSAASVCLPRDGGWQC